MPWKTFKVEGGFKNWKVDEQGNKVGAPLSNKPLSSEEADKQRSALYASEKKETWTKEGKLYVGPRITEHYLEEAKQTGKPFYELLHEHYPGAIVAFPEMLPEELRPKELETKEAKGMMEENAYVQAEMPMTGPCSWEEMDAMEANEELTESLYKMNDKMGMMAHNVMRNPMMEDKAAALADLAKGYADRMGKMMSQPAEKSAADIARQIAGDNQPNDDKAVLGGAQTNNLPDSDFLYIEPGGKKDDTGRTVPRSLRHLPVPDAAHLRNAITRLSQSNTGTTNGDKWLTESLRKTLLARARKMLEGANKKELFIWKEGDTYRWIAAYSNNRRDGDNPPEIISTESHKEFDQALEKGEWPMPELWLWHIPFSVGQADYHAFDESTGFPLAAGHFYKGMEWAAEGALEADWDGVSHGMPKEWIERDPADSSIIVRHRTKEISFLPLWAAANKLAFSIINKESTMTDQEKGLPAHKREEFITAFGEERVKQIEAALEDKAKEADEAGIEKKEAPVAEPLTPDSQVVKAIEMVIERLAALDTRLKAIEDKQAEAVEEKEQPFDLMAFLASKSAINQPTTKVRANSKEAKDGPEETKPEQESFTQQAAGIRVSIADQFIQANQEWYGQKNGR